MSQITEALKMIDAYTSVGVVTFDVTRTGVMQEKISYRPGVNPGGMKLMLQYFIPFCWRVQQNFIVRPRRPRSCVLAQLDDLDGRKLDRVGCRAFLSLETSPGNFQAWVAIADGDADLARRLVKGLDVDWNASRAVRIAGSPNCKEKYAPDFPEVKIAGIRPGLIVQPPELQDLLPRENSIPIAPPPWSQQKFPPENRGWPSYQQCLSGARLKMDGTPNRSGVDYFWCKWALQRGNTPESVAEKLVEVSLKAQIEVKNGNAGYVWRTVSAAMRAW